MISTFDCEITQSKNSLAFEDLRLAFVYCILFKSYWIMKISKNLILYINSIETLQNIFAIKNTAFSKENAKIAEKIIK